MDTERRGSQSMAPSRKPWIKQSTLNLIASVFLVAVCVGWVIGNWPNDDVQNQISPSSLPTEYLCFDLPFSGAFRECCARSGDADLCEHNAAACFDLADCRDGCRLDMSQSTSVLTGDTYTFTCAAPTETCNVDTLMVRTVLSSAPITNTILHCAATTALGSTATVASTLTTASVVPTETSEGNSHATRKARSDRKDSMESTLLEATTGHNPSTLKTITLPGLSGSQTANTPRLITAATIFTASPGLIPPQIAAAAINAQTSSVVDPVSTSSSASSDDLSSIDGTKLQMSSAMIIASQVFAGCATGISIGGFIIAIFGKKLCGKRDKKNKKKRTTTTATTRQGFTNSNFDSTNPAIIARPQPVHHQLRVKPSQTQALLTRYHNDGQSLGGVFGPSASATTAGSNSSRSTTMTNASLMAALAATENGVLYDRSGDVRTEDFSIPRRAYSADYQPSRLRDQREEDEAAAAAEYERRVHANTDEDNEEHEHENDRTIATSCCSFEDLSSDVVELQQATAVKYYTPREVGQGRQIHVSQSKRSFSYPGV